MFSPLKALILAALVACTTSAHAMSLQTFYAMSDREQASYLSDYVLKMRNDIAPKNPELAQAIVTYFSHKQEGKPTSEGAEALLVEELRVDALAKEGKADLSKIQIEGLIVYVVKQHFKA